MVRSPLLTDYSESVPMCLLANESFVSHGPNSERTRMMACFADTRLFQTAQILVTLVLITSGPTAFVQGQNSSSAKFYNQDAIASLISQGETVPHGGTYYLWVWAEKTHPVFFQCAGKTFQTHPSESSLPSVTNWQRVGKVRLVAQQTLRVTLLKETQLKQFAYLAFSSAPDYHPGQVLELARGKPDSPSALVVDRRSKRPRTLDDDIGFQAGKFKNLKNWKERAQELRERILVSSGLWPMPPKTALNPIIRSKMQRDGYTIEKVILETFPGFFLTGNLYRPSGENHKNAVHNGQRPGILSPHGHWSEPDGRLNPEVQPRHIQLARMGAVVFTYDMVGFSDSKWFGHNFEDSESDNTFELLGIDLTGLHLWNSIRALDFLANQPEIDPNRIACTGASGGGTQTFLLTAVDDRIRVAAPVCMVSSIMQGGCDCENAANLRIGTNNIEFAALTAPRPLILIGATGDWTKNIDTTGYPEIQTIYSLFDARDRVFCKVFDYDHNYNQTSRQEVYRWFSKFVFGGDNFQEIKEQVFELESPDTLLCFTPSHPLPDHAVNKEQLALYFRGMAASQSDQLRPRSPEQWSRARHVIQVGYQHRIPIQVPSVTGIDQTNVSDRLNRDRYTVQHRIVTSGQGDQIPLAIFSGSDSASRVTVIVHPQGIQGLVTASGEPVPLIQELLESGQEVVTFDAYMTGDHNSPFGSVTPEDTRHFRCYNRVTFVERIQDVVTVLTATRHRSEIVQIDLIGIGEAGAWCLLARPHVPFVRRTVIDTDQFDFQFARSSGSERLLPGALRFGGLSGLSTVVAGIPLFLHNTGTGFDPSWIQDAHRIQGESEILQVSREKASPEMILKWLDSP